MLEYHVSVFCSSSLSHSLSHSHTLTHSNTLTLTLKQQTPTHKTTNRCTSPSRIRQEHHSRSREQRASTYVFRVMDTGFCGQSLRTCEKTTILVECSSHDRSCVLVLCYSEQSDTHVLCMYHERQSIEKLVRVFLFENGVFVHSLKLIHKPTQVRTSSTRDALCSDACV